MAVVLLAGDVIVLAGRCRVNGAEDRCVRETLVTLRGELLYHRFALAEIAPSQGRQHVCAILEHQQEALKC